MKICSGKTDEAEDLASLPKSPHRYLPQSNYSIGTTYSHSTAANAISLALEVNKLATGLVQYYYHKKLATQCAPELKIHYQLMKQINVSN